MEDARTKNMIELEVRRQMDRHSLDTNNIKSSIKRDLEDKLKRVVIKYVDGKITNFTDSISEKVYLEIGREVPKFLDQNGKMQDILKEHKAKVVDVLEKVVRENLNRICNEDQYHEITNSYTNAIINKGDNAVREIYSRANEQQWDQQNRFNEAISSMQNQVDGTTTRLKSELEQLEVIKRRVANLENSNSFLNKTVFFLSIAFGSVVGLATLRYLHRL